MSQTDDAVKERVRLEKKEPPRYKVLLLNDDYTTMEFVILVLESVFEKSPAEAYQIMMHVHVHGQGLAGLYPGEGAFTQTDIDRTLKAIAEEA